MNFNPYLWFIQCHCAQAAVRNLSYVHPNMADEKRGKILFSPKTHFYTYVTKKRIGR